MESISQYSSFSFRRIFAYYFACCIFPLANYFTNELPRFEWALLLASTFNSLDDCKITTVHICPHQPHQVHGEASGAWVRTSRVGSSVRNASLANVAASWDVTCGGVFFSVAGNLKQLFFHTPNFRLSGFQRKVLDQSCLDLLIAVLPCRQNWTSSSGDWYG